MNISNYFPLVDSNRMVRGARRVGGRRERRFEHQDLVNFLEQTSIPGTIVKQPRNEKENEVAGILLGGMSIHFGNHLCSLYETEKGRTKLAVPFLADGLTNHNKCFLLASRRNQELILGDMGDVYSDIESDLKNSRLILSDGLPDHRDLYDFFEQQFLEAARRGDQYIRVLSDMDWAIDKGMSTDDLMEFEKRYNHSLAKSFSVVSLCQYDARRFTGTEILHALKNHGDTFQYPMSRLVGF